MANNLIEYNRGQIYGLNNETNMNRFNQISKINQKFVNDQSANEFLGFDDELEQFAYVDDGLNYDECSY